VIDVDIEFYKQLDKGALIGFFTVIIEPNKPYRQKIAQCRHFKNNDSEWISFPQQEIKPQDGSKSSYYPIITFLDNDYCADLKTSILNKIKEKNAKIQTSKSSSDSIQSESSFVWSA
jgi:hypothetical protein